MIVTRYAVCSARKQKPVTRAVCDSRAEAEKVLGRIRERDVRDPEESYWIAELGPESEAWRWLLPEPEGHDPNEAQDGKSGVRE